MVGSLLYQDLAHLDGYLEAVFTHVFTCKKERFIHFLVDFVTTKNADNLGLTTKTDANDTVAESELATC